MGTRTSVSRPLYDIHVPTAFVNPFTAVKPQSPWDEVYEEIASVPRDYLHLRSLIHI